ncbi:MAG: hydrogenase nickel incorporation protein HypB [Desulfosarcina sp.]|nr:hydrogenase nickel incorporation protein HypB [Desulfobacterales bacterium]
MEIKVVKKVLDANNEIALQNRKMFSENQVFTINMMSSPGSGKTSILEQTLTMITPEIKAAVIVGDICTTNDAMRIAATGVPAVQINTNEFGGDCHIGAHFIKKAAADLDLENIDLLIIENIGNLVCPAEFDIGENIRVVALSVTEGEDKPVKYPLMFRVCDAALLNKIDLLPHLDYKIDEAIKNIKMIKHEMPVFQMSAKTGQGLQPWIDWLKGMVNAEF